MSRVLKEFGGCKNVFIIKDGSYLSIEKWKFTFTNIKNGNQQSEVIQYRRPSTNSIRYRPSIFTRTKKVPDMVIVGNPARKSLSPPNDIQFFKHQIRLQTQI